MEHWLRAEEWKVLSADEKGKRCRFMAEQACLLANGTDQPTKQAYLRIANEWLQLALEIECSGEASKNDAEI